MSARPDDARAPLRLVSPASGDDAHAAPTPAPTVGAVPRHRVGFMAWLERRSQPYIVAIMAVVAVVRGFYLFTDKLVNLAHYPAIDIPLSIGTGLCLSVASELTVTIAGRRGKLYKDQLFAAKLALASCAKNQKELWQVEVERLTEQVAANRMAMRVSMAMSVVAAASYLIDSTGAASFMAFAVASSLAAYVLYLMYYHGVQTDEIKEDGTRETADQIAEGLNVMRVEQVAALRAQMQGATVGPTARLALIASGLGVPEQRRVMPVLRLLLRADEPGEQEDETAAWLSMRDVAERRGDALGRGRDDNLLRKYRRRASDNAHKYPDTIRLSPTRGWVVEPAFAETFFQLHSLDTSPGGTLVVVDADPAPSA